MNKKFYLRSYSITPIGSLLTEKDWLAGELSVNSARGRVLIDTGAGVNITTRAFAEKAAAKITVGPKIRMIFADARESICNLQAEIEFTIGEVKSKATFRVLTTLLPGVELILGKTWLKEAKPTIDFETGSVYVNRVHALGPKVEISSLQLAPVATTSVAASILTLATILASVVATTTTLPNPIPTTLPSNPAQDLPKQPPKVEDTPVYVAVVGAKAMHKTLKGSNDFTALLFVGEADSPSEASAGEASGTFTHPALKNLVGQFQDTVLAGELRKGVPNSKLTHKIELIEGNDPPGQRPFRLAASEAAEISKQLTELIDLVLIRPSNSDFGAPILLVKKKDGTFRRGIDYRRLNAITKKDSSRT